MTYCRSSEQYVRKRNAPRRERKLALNHLREPLPRPGLFRKASVIRAFRFDPGSRTRYLLSASPTLCLPFRKIKL